MIQTNCFFFFFLFFNYSSSFIVSRFFAVVAPVRFHIAHLYEVSNRIKTAKEQYEQLLQDKQLAPLLRADIYRQLGKPLPWAKPVL